MALVESVFGVVFAVFGVVFAVFDAFWGAEELVGAADAR